MLNASNEYLMLDYYNYFLFFLGILVNDLLSLCLGIYKGFKCLIVLFFSRVAPIVAKSKQSRYKGNYANNPSKWGN